MNSYKRYAFAIQILSYIMIVTTALATVFNWFMPISYFGLTPNFMPCMPVDITNLTSLQKLLGFFVSTVLSGLLILGLVLVIQLMKQVQHNEYFSLMNIYYLRVITKVALVYAIYTPICSSLISIILSMNNAPGERMVTITVGSAEIINIIVFCFMFLIMKMLERGYELKHEQDLTI